MEVQLLGKKKQSETTSRLEPLKEILGPSCILAIAKSPVTAPFDQSTKPVMRESTFNQLVQVQLTLTLKCPPRGSPLIGWLDVWWILSRPTLQSFALKISAVPSSEAFPFFSFFLRAAEEIRVSPYCSDPVSMDITEVSISSQNKIIATSHQIVWFRCFISP